MRREKKKTGGQGEGAGYAKVAGTTPLSITVDDLPFRHGNTLVPGSGRSSPRVWSSLIPAELINNYDVRVLQKRTEGFYVGPRKIPPMASTMGVQRTRTVQVEGRQM